MAQIHNSNLDVSKLAEWLRLLVCRYLAQNRLIDATISNALLYDVALHWKKDISRIEASKTVVVRPTEHAGYLAFWIRKLKPISQAYYVSDLKRAGSTSMTVDPTSEIIDINEQAAIRLAFAHLAGCCQHGKIVAYDHIAQEFSILTYEDKAFSNLVHKYLSQKLDPDGKTVMDSLIYDMRYGAFGPHHFIHIFDQFVFSLDLKKLMN